MSNKKWEQIAQRDTSKKWIRHIKIWRDVINKNYFDQLHFIEDRVENGTEWKMEQFLLNNLAKDLKKILMPKNKFIKR